mmetsp:Transcript_2615/g.8688  ORF Transcript_2615/g.8688 Transcript_2615/m.8688 type:complete len:203 (+) Transcript_2615:843-1451(+)
MHGRGARHRRALRVDVVNLEDAILIGDDHAGSVCVEGDGGDHRLLDGHEIVPQQWEDLRQGLRGEAPEADRVDLAGALLIARDRNSLSHEALVDRHCRLVRVERFQLRAALRRQVEVRRVVDVLTGRVVGQIVEQCDVVRHCTKEDTLRPGPEERIDASGSRDLVERRRQRMRLVDSKIPNLDAPISHVIAEPRCKESLAGW